VSAGLSVLGVAVWTPEYPDLQHFLARNPRPAAKPEAPLLPVRARGRASPLSLMFAQVVEQAQAAAGVQGTLPSIYGSAYGEMAATLALLDQLHGDDGRLSPAKFQASVHNTASGLISIAQANRSFSTALAAGHDTVAMTLVEAWAWLSQRPGELVLACADESAAAPLVAELPFGALAMGMLLSNRAQQRAALAVLQRPERARTIPDAAAEHENPCASALPLVRAIFGAAPATVILNRAAELTWQIHVEPVVHAP
jgi:hypothetical protein